MSTQTLSALRAQLWWIVDSLEKAHNTRTINYLGGHAAALRFALELLDPDARWVDTHLTFKRKLAEESR